MFDQSEIKKKFDLKLLKLTQVLLKMYFFLFKESKFSLKNLNELDLN